MESRGEFSPVRTTNDGGTKLLNSKPTSPMKRTERSPTMRLIVTKKTASPLIGLVLILLATQSVATAPPPPLPNPVLYLTGTEVYQAGGKQFIRYKYDVLNKGDYPADFFAPAPALPPCGKNTKSSRTW